MRSPRFYGDSTTTPSPVVTNHYDTSGRIDWQTDQLGRQTSFDYTTVPGTTLVTNPKGNVTAYGYEFGLLTSTTRGYGTALAQTWLTRYDPDTVGQTQLIDASGRQTLKTYDPAGNLLTVTTPLGRITRYTYNSLNEVTSITEPKQVNGHAITTSFTYDAAGNLLTKASPLLDSNGNTTATATTMYTYGDASHPGDVTAVTDPNNNVARFTYDTYGNLTSSKDGANDLTTFGYDAVRGWRTSMVSPKGNVAGGNPAAYTTSYGHDAYGRLTTTRDPLWTSSSPTLHQTVRAYDADGNLTSTADASGNTTTIDYDAAGQQTIVHRPGGTTTRTDYWPDGSVHVRYDGANQPTTYTYNSLGRMISAADPLGRTTQYVYDAVGNVRMIVDAQNRATTKTFNADYEVTAITYSDGVTPNVTAVGYDADGQRTSMTDGTGTSTWTYDSLHRKTSYTNGANQTVGYGYDLGGRLTTITYPGATGTVTRTYDAADRLRTVMDWNNKTTTFDYDENSNLKSQLYPNSTTATRTFNATDAVTSISDALTGAPNSPFTSFTYGRNASSRVSSVTSTGVPSDNHTFGYDGLGRLASMDAATFTYDAADNLTKRNDNAQQIFDAANQLSATTLVPAISAVGSVSAGDSTSSSLTLTLPTGKATDDQVILAVSLPNGKTVTTPTGYTIIGTYTSGTGNTAAKVIVYRHTVVASDTSVTVSFQGKIAKSVALTLYRGVNPTAPIDVTTNNFTAGGTTVSTYAATSTVTNDRVLVITGASGAAGTWTLPAPLTLRTQRTGGTTDVAIGDEAFSGVGTIPAFTATHTTSTQLVAAMISLKPAETSFTFDSVGNRTSVTPLGQPTTTMSYDQAMRLKGYATASYTYNGDGLRMSKTVSAVTSNYTWDDSQAVPELLSDGVISYIYGPDGIVLEQISPTGTLYYYQDQLGSTRTLTNSAGSVVATYTYSPYGQLTASTGTVSNPFGFAGEYRDTESGLVYLRARYYDPVTGQFMTRDPLVATTRSAYGYVGGDPLNGSDPTGLCFGPDVICNAASSVGGAVANSASAVGGFVVDHRHTIIDIGTTLGAATVTGMCVASVACGIAAGAVGLAAIGVAGFGAHVASDWTIQDDHQISMSQALFRAGFSTGAGAACGLLFTQGCFGSAAFPAGQGLIGSAIYDLGLTRIYPWLALADLSILKQGLLALWPDC